jgi:dephospho-CoA kinase
MGEDKIPLIGITGGVASGKSFVAEQFRAKGAAVVSADQLAHEVLRYDEIKQRACERWGDAILGDGGEIDRQRLAAIVFAPPPGGPRELKFLEELTHPAIGRLAREQVERLGREKTATAIVLDVPLLVESGWNEWCDAIVFVDVPRVVRLKRAQARGWTEEDFARREASQESLETKRKLADVVIDNSATAETTQAQVDHFWRKLAGSPRPG